MWLDFIFNLYAIFLSCNFSFQHNMRNDEAISMADIVKNIFQLMSTV